MSLKAFSWHQRALAVQRPEHGTAVAATVEDQHRSWRIFPQQAMQAIGHHGQLIAEQFDGLREVHPQRTAPLVVDPVLMAAGLRRPALRPPVLGPLRLAEVRREMAVDQPPVALHPPQRQVALGEYAL